MEELLMVLLECGSLDLQILDDVGYDIGEIAEELQMEGLKPTLNAITDAIFTKGQQELVEAVDEAIQNRKQEQEDLDEEVDGEEFKQEYDRLQEEIDELESLNPEEDMEWFCNCLDTSCWFRDNEDIYMKYLADAIKDIEDNMGFGF